MSTYVYLRCDTCDAMSGSANHAEAQLAQLWRRRALITEFVEAFGADIEMAPLSYYDGENPLWFVVSHREHAVSLWDEYGYTYNLDTVEREQEKGARE